MNDDADLIVTKYDCAGCDDDFYNGKNPLGVSECWMLKTAAFATRWRIGTWTEPTTPAAFTEVMVPGCYHAKGFSFYAKLPDFAIDPIRLRANETTKEQA